MSIQHCISLRGPAGEVLLLLLASLTAVRAMLTVLEQVVPVVRDRRGGA